MFYYVKFNRFNGYRSSRSELQIFNWIVRRRVPLFEVSLKFKSPLISGASLSLINAARFIETSCFGVHPYLWPHLQRGLFLDTHEPMWRMRDMFLTHWIITSQIQRCEYWSILCIEGCQFGVSVRCQQCSGNAPVWIWWGGGRSARRNSWTCWWTKPLGCTVGPQAPQWPKDVNFNGYRNFWRLWGWKPWKWREIVQVRSSQATCQQVSIDQHRSTTNLIELADLIWWPCMGFSALTPLTLSSSMVSGDNIKNRLDVFDCLQLHMT